MGEPLARLLGGLPMGLDVLLDELGGQGVHEIGGKLRVGRIVADFDEPRVGISANFQVLWQPVPESFRGLTAWPTEPRLCAKPQAATFLFRSGNSFFSRSSFRRYPIE